MEGCLRQLSSCQDEVVEAPSVASYADRFEAQKGPFDQPLCVWATGLHPFTLVLNPVTCVQLGWRLFKIRPGDILRKGLCWQGGELDVLAAFFRPRLCKIE